MSDVIFNGAEAEVRAGEYLGRPAVLKQRRVKGYRHAELDARLRRQRLRSEASILALAGRAGVAVPQVFDVDESSSTLTMERIEGATLRRTLSRGDGDAAALLSGFGRGLAKLHAAGIVHGDPTTSNVIVRDGSTVFVDFGLSSRSENVEDRGVDLLLVERTLQSTHPERSVEWIERVHDGYRDAFPDAQVVIDRARDIRGRSRYV